MRTIAAALAATAALLAPSGAAAAPPSPFGHGCNDQNGVLFCPASTLGERVPSFDGVPIDVDVTLPETGDGPFPTIVMVHGLGQSKTAFESSDDTGGGQLYHYNNHFYAKRGYAVVNLSQRGYGNSCGAPDSRTSPGCDTGWQHLDDQAYEAHDIQYLLGLLVDEGVAKPGGLGVTGISYGGGMTNMLAYLHDRVRQPDGSFTSWTSPNGTPLKIDAGWSRWGWADLAYALAPNGRFLDSKKWQLGQSTGPVGVFKKSFVDALYLITGLNFRAPEGVDPNAELAAPYRMLSAGEPYSAELASFLALGAERKSAIGLFGTTPAPLLVEDGWTDDLFPANQALMIYRDTGQAALQLGDLGHGRGANKPGQEQFFNDQGVAFFDAHLKGQGVPPAPGSVTAFTQTCPKARPAGGPIQAASWDAIHPGSFRISGAKPQRVSSRGGDPAAAKTFDQIASADPCPTAAANKGHGTARYSRTVGKGFTLLGLPTVKARVATKGAYGQLDARIYDVYKGRELLVSRSAYRLTASQKGAVTFQLNGNGWRFAKGHTVELELLGRDPNALRPSNGSFTVTVSKLSLSLPTRERKPA